MQCYVIDSNKLNNIYWKTRQKMRSNSMSNRQGEKHYPKMRRAVGEKKKDNKKFKKAAKDIEVKFKTFYKFLPNDRDNVHRIRKAPVRKRSSSKGSINSLNADKKFTVIQPHPPNDFNIRRRYPFSMKNRIMLETKGNVMNNDNNKDNDNNTDSNNNNNNNNDQKATSVTTINYNSKLEKPLPEINNNIVKHEVKVEIAEDIKVHVPQRKYEKIESSPIIFIDMELEHLEQQNDKIKKQYKSSNAKPEFFSLSNSIIDYHNKGGENKRPLSARSKYIETMKEMKLTPKPSSIIGKYNESRQTLGFQHVSFGDEQAFAIANSAFMLPDVQTINFNHNNLSPRFSQKISHSISPWITNLNLSNNSIRSNGSKQWAKALLNAVNLECLYMKNNKIGDTGGAILIESLTNLKQLRVLDLSENSLANKSAKVIQFLMIQSLSLSELFLRWNWFSKHEMETLSEGLFSNKNLITIDFAFNSLGKCKSIDQNSMKKETKQFFSSLCQHPSLTHVDLSFNEIGVDDCDTLQHVTDKNFSIIGFHIEGNRAMINHAGFIEETEDISSIKTYEELQHEINLKIATKIFIKLYFLWNEKNISPSMLFRAMNEDGEGNVDCDEFATGLNEVCGLDISAKEANAVFSIVDDDGSGEISQRELSRAIREAGKEARNTDVFNSDSDEDNDLDIEDISFHHAPKRQPNSIDTVLSTKVNERCWVCSGFSEQKIMYKPYGYKNEDDAKSLNVVLYLSFDTFLPKRMIWNENKKCFEFYCMVPPGFLRYYISVNGRGTYSIDERSIPLTISGRIPQDLNQSQRKEGEDWWTLLKRLMFKTRRCNLREVPVRIGPMINLFVYPRRTAESQQMHDFFKDKLNAMVAKGLYNERLHADYDTLIDVDEYDQSSNSIKVACKRLLSHSISIDNINFIKSEKVQVEKALLSDCCFKNFRTIQKLYNMYLIVQSREDNYTDVILAASSVLKLRLKTILQFCVDFKIIEDENKDVKEAEKDIDENVPLKEKDIERQEQELLLLKKSTISKIFQAIAEDGYDCINFNGFFRFLIKLSNIYYFFDRDSNKVKKHKPEEKIVSSNIASLIFYIIRNPICVQLLNDYHPTNYMIKIFETSKILDGIENIMEDVRYLFCQFSKKDRNVNSYHCAIDIYGLNIQSFYKLFSSKTLHKYYGFSNEVLFSIFITTLYTGTSNINYANRRSICNEALTFEEFLKAICRVSYSLLLVFFETHTATSSYKKVFQPILKEDIFRYKSEGEIEEENEAMKTRIPKIIHKTDVENVFSKICKSEDILKMSLRFVVDVMKESSV